MSQKLVCCECREDFGDAPSCPEGRDRFMVCRDCRIKMYKETDSELKRIFSVANFHELRGIYRAEMSKFARAINSLEPLKPRKIAGLLATPKPPVKDPLFNPLMRDVRVEKKKGETSS